MQQLSVPNSLLDFLAPDLAWKCPKEEIQAGGEMHFNHANSAAFLFPRSAIHFHSGREN